MENCDCNNATFLRLSCLLLPLITRKPPFSVSSGYLFSAFHSPRCPAVSRPHSPGSLTEEESVRLLLLFWESVVHTNPFKGFLCDTASLWVIVCSRPTMSSEMDNRKIAILKPDYLDLQRETRATRKRLRRAKSKKDNLLAEVRFLRRKLKMLKQRDSNPKWKGYGEMSTNQHMEIQAVDVQFESASRATTCEEEDNPQGSTQEEYSIVNEYHASQIKPFAAREFQVFWEPLRAGSSTFADAVKRSLVDKNGSVSISKPSIYKDRSNGFVTPITAKRKISWQDQLSLKV